MASNTPPTGSGYSIIPNSDPTPITDRTILSVKRRPAGSGSQPGTSNPFASKTAPLVQEAAAGAGIGRPAAAAAVPSTGSQFSFGRFKSGLSNVAPKADSSNSAAAAAASSSAGSGSMATDEQTATSFQAPIQPPNLFGNKPNTSSPNTTLSSLGKLKMKYPQVPIQPPSLLGNEPNTSSRNQEQATTLSSLEKLKVKRPQADSQFSFGRFKSGLSNVDPKADSSNSAAAAMTAQQQSIAPSHSGSQANTMMSEAEHDTNVYKAEYHANDGSAQTAQRDLSGDTVMGAQATDAGAGAGTGAVKIEGGSQENRLGAKRLADDTEQLNAQSSSGERREIANTRDVRGLGQLASEIVAMGKARMKRVLKKKRGVRTLGDLKQQAIEKLEKVKKTINEHIQSLKTEGRHSWITPSFEKDIRSFEILVLEVFGKDANKTVQEIREKHSNPIAGKEPYEHKINHLINLGELLISSLDDDGDENAVTAQPGDSSAFRYANAQAGAGAGTSEPMATNSFRAVDAMSPTPPIPPSTFKSFSANAQAGAGAGASRPAAAASSSSSRTTDAMSLAPPIPPSAFKSLSTNARARAGTGASRPAAAASSSSSRATDVMSPALPIPLSNFKFRYTNAQEGAGAGKADAAAASSSSSAPRSISPPTRPSSFSAAREDNPAAAASGASSDITSMEARRDEAEREAQRYEDEQARRSETWRSDPKQWRQQQ